MPRCGTSRVVVVKAREELMLSFTGAIGSPCITIVVEGDKLVIGDYQGLVRRIERKDMEVRFAQPKQQREEAASPPLAEDLNADVVGRGFIDR